MTVLIKTTFKNFSSKVFRLKSISAIIFAAVICVMIFVVGVVSANSGENRSGSSNASLTGRGELSNEWETVVMRVTAYCPCRRCCGKFSDGITASGHKIRRGDVFAAADKKYGFGTEMIIPGYNNSKTVEVLDRGRVIRGNRLDVFFNSHKTALKWGVKYLEVKVRHK